MKVTRVKNRVYDGGGRIKSHAEYAIAVDGATVAHVIKVNSCWIVVEGHSDTRFGLIISPLNLRLIKDLKPWAIKKWGNDGR